jgi:hypothetical protein
MTVRLVGTGQHLRKWCKMFQSLRKCIRLALYTEGIGI